MIDHLGRMLRALLLARLPAFLHDEAQVRFEPPDERFRSTVVNLAHAGMPVMALNLYLVDVRRNVRIGVTEHERVLRQGVVVDRPPPSRVDCEYLITAWSPAAAGDQGEPTLDEQALLYRVLAVLENAAPLNAARLFPPPSSVPGALPEALRDVDLPTALLDRPVVDPGRFWPTMGTDHRWRAAIPLVVTLPVLLDEVEVGPPVHTRVLGFNVRDDPDSPGSSEEVRLPM